MRELRPDSISEGYNEPGFWIWSSLAHQGDVYSASFAAVPHIINVLKIDPANADHSFFQFPAWVEICRRKKSVPIPPDLEHDYFDALNRIPALVAATFDREWDNDLFRVALSAIAAAKGDTAVAEVILELIRT